MNSNAIILFTKVPRAGQSKTRLQPFLSAEQCVMLQEAFIKDIFYTLSNVKADIIICYTPENNSDRLKCLITENATYISQRGLGLGEKMYNAICDTLTMGYNGCILIGSDVPLLSDLHIKAAFDILDKKDIVISQTEDGGYYLIGMKKPYISAFNVEYSGDRVFENTCKAIENKGLSYGIGIPTLDIDNKEDLLKLVDILRLSDCLQCVYTKKALQAIFMR